MPGHVTCGATILAGTTSLCPMPAASRDPYLGRRELVVGGFAAALTGALGLGGCSRLTDPVVHGTRSAPPGAQAAPRPSFVTGAAGAADLRSGLQGWPTAGQAAWAEQVRSMLDAHVQLLSAKEPLAGLPSPEVWASLDPSASPSGGESPTEAGFTAAATALADKHQDTALSAKDPSEAMLWASLSVATRVNAKPGPAPTPTDLPRTVEFGTEVEARNVVLGYLHSLAQWLELDLGDANKVQEALLNARLREVRAAIRAEQKLIRSLKGTPVAPLPGYSWPGPGEEARTRFLIERQVMDAWGPVVATSPQARRKQALDQMVSWGRGALAGGAGTSYFPGWV